MNKRFLYVLVFAFVVAGLAVLVFIKVFQGRLSTKQLETPTSQVLVATRTLNVGTLIRDIDLRATTMASVPGNAVLKREDLIGRGVVSTIYQDEPFLEPRLAPKGAGAGLAAIIPPGMRAVAVRVNEIIGVAGFVVPGMRVDVLIAGNPPNRTASSIGTVAKTLLQNIEVLSAGQSMQKDAEGKPMSVPVINLLVTPEQAEVLSLASTETKIQLVLRNPLDTETVKTPGTAVANLFSGTKLRALDVSDEEKPRPRPVLQPVTAPKEKPVTIQIEVIQGGKRDTTRFAEAPTTEGTR